MMGRDNKVADHDKGDLKSVRRHLKDFIVKAFSFKNALFKVW